MDSRFDWQRRLPYLFWLCTLIALVTWALHPGYVVGWDLNVYIAALKSLLLGHDPYADAIAIQRAFHVLHPNGVPPGVAVPFVYVYSPITLPILHLASKFPLALDGVVYWTCYFAAVAFTIWVSTKFFESEDEKKVFALLVPIAVFFPGLLENDVVFSGNVAYILYALVLLGAWIGWRRDNWIPFYLIMLGVSCVKAPLLYLVFIPVLTARKQWVPALITMAGAIALFLMQPHIWPTLYRNYMTGVELQFSINHDFSSSPSGLTADALYDVLPYKLVWGGFWAFCSCLFGAILLWLRRQFMEGRLTLQQWVPVMLCGVALLNPRIMEYDFAPITIFMAIVLWRVFGYRSSRKAQIWKMAIFFAVANMFSNTFGGLEWRPTACVTLVLTYFLGAAYLYRIVSDARLVVSEETALTT